MERNLPKSSNFDVYLSSSDFRRRSGGARITSIDRSEKEGFLRIGFKDGAHEVFLTDSGEPIASRMIEVWPGYRYPKVHIDGNANDLEYSIDRNTGGWRDGSRVINETFIIEFALTAQAFNRTATYGIMYGASRDLEILFSQDRVAKVAGLENPRTRVRFVGVMGTVWVSDNGKEIPLSYTAFDNEVVHPQTNFSFRLEKEKIAERVYKFRMFTKDLSSGKESIVAFPSEIDVQAWDKKIRTPDKNWRNLGKEMPISLQTIS